MAIPLARPDIGPQEEAAVLSVLRSGTLSMGPWTERFESAVASRADVRHGVACSSGTAGLHLLLTALGVGPGDEVITSSFSFIASANAIRYTGATPVFADVDPVTLCLDPDQVAKLITTRTRAILPVDIFGHPAPLRELRLLADEAGLAVVEDACEALGAERNGVPCGSGRFAHGAVFAFYPNKQITTGEGGMVVTDDERIASLCRSLRNQGRDESGTWLNHLRLGFNYRMDELSAALGAVQMDRLDEILEGRAQVAARYNRLFRDIPGVQVPEPAPGATISWFVYVIRLAEGIDRDGVMADLVARGIGCRPYFSPIHRQPCYQGEACSPVPLPITERVAASTVALPFHTRLTAAEAEEVVAAVAEAVCRRRREPAPSQDCAD